MGAPKDISFLPEELEQKLRDVQNTVNNLSGQKAALEKNIIEKNEELVSIGIAITNANVELSRITGIYEGRTKELNERDRKQNDRDAILSTWAADLEEKEKKINKYIAIFDNMKNVI